MIIAYLMPNIMDEPRDGLGYLACAATREEALAKLKKQVTEGYEQEEVAINWLVDEEGKRDRVEVVAGSEWTELYWLHFVED